jgi:phosphoglycolate phosphatase
VVKRAVLFDLEGTLVDVSAIDHLRDQRRWSEYVASVNRTRLFPGVRELLDRLREHEVKIAVVTNVPSKLANALVAHHQIDCDARVCYHDVPRGKHKPDPAMCAKAMMDMGVVREGVVGVGDRQEDCGAFHSAGLPSYCAGWNGRAQTAAGWDEVLEQPSDVVKKLQEASGQ